MSPSRALAVVALFVLAAPACGQELPRDPLPPGAVASLGTTRLRHKHYVVSLAFAPDGKSLASGGYDFMANVWDTATGLPRFALPRQGTYVYGVAYSPDGKLLATTGGGGHTVRVWDAATGRGAHVIPAGQQGATCVRFSPDGKLLAFGLYGAAPIILWDVQAGREVRRLDGHAGGTIALEFTADGKKLVSSGRDTGAKVKREKKGAGDPTDDVRVWDVAEGKLLTAFGHPGNEGDVYSVAVAPDGRTLATGTRYSARLWDLNKGAELRKFEKTGSPVAFSPDGKVLATGEWENAVHLWDAATGTHLHRMAGHGSNLSALAFSPDGKVLASGASDGIIRLWKTSSGEDALPLEGHRYAVRGVAVSPNGRAIVTFGGDGDLRLWGAASGLPLRTLSSSKVPHYGHNLGSAMPARLLFTPDGNRIAADGVVWDIAAGRPDPSGPTRVLAWSPDGHTAAVQGSSDKVDLVTGGGRVLRTLSPRAPGGSASYEATTAAAFSPDGKLLATACADDRLRGRDERTLAHTIQLWEVATGKLLHRFGPQTVPPDSLAFTPDGETLVASGDAVRLFKVKTGKELATLGELEFRAWASGGPVALSPDGRLAAAPTKGPGIVIYEVASRKAVHRLPGHDQLINAVAFTPDGWRLVSGGLDNTALVWDLAPRRKGPAAKLTDADLDRLWDDLAGGDAAAAYAAVWALARDRDRAAALFEKNLRPVPEPDLARVPRLVAALGDDNFKARTAAADELRRMGAEAEPLLTMALEGKLTLEARRRVEALLAELARQPVPAERLRVVRALHALELSAAPESAAVLERLARSGGQTGRDAEAVLRRLAARRRADPDLAKAPPPPAAPAARDPVVLKGHEGGVAAVAVAPDGKTLASAGTDGTLRLWDRAGAKELHRFTAKGRGWAAVAFSSDGKRLAAAAGSAIRVWDLDGDLKFTRFGLKDEPVLAFAFSPDGKWLAAGSRGGAVRLWHVTDREKSHLLGRHDGDIQSLAFSSDGKRLYVAAQLEVTNTVGGDTVPMFRSEPVHVWDVATRKPLPDLPESASALALAPDGKRLAALAVKSSTVIDREVTVTSTWALTVLDPATGETVLERPAPGGLVAFSPCGRYLLVGGGGRLRLGGAKAPFRPAVKGEGPPRLVELASGQDVLTFPRGTTTAAAFLPDGTAVVCGTESGEVLLYPLDPPAAAKPAPAKLWADLSGDDAAAAYRAIHALRADPKQALALLSEKLKLPSADDPAVLKLIAALGAEGQAERDAAEAELRRLGAAAEPALMKALRGAADPAVRRRLLDLLGAEGVTRYPDALGWLRAVEVLEAIGSPEARELLRRVAEGPPLAVPTREARAALERLARIAK